MKLLLKFQAFALASVISAGGQAHCEPSPGFQTLIDTPVSLFSFGIFQLNSELRRAISETGPLPELPPDHQKFEPGVEYNWDRNQLTIAIFGFHSEADKKQDPEEECRQVLASIRTFLGINNKTGKPYLKTSYLRQYFTPWGYSLAPINDKVLSELDANTVITFEYSLPSGEEIFSCEGQLLDTGYSVKKQ